MTLPGYEMRNTGGGVVVSFRRETTTRWRLTVNGTPSHTSTVDLPFNRWLKVSASIDAGTLVFAVTRTTGEVIWSDVAAFPTVENVVHAWHWVAGAEEQSRWVDDIRIGAAAAPPYRRIFPRDDHLAGGPGRNYPPPRSVQLSNRTSGYL